jgi:hypothetical protein
MLHQRIERSVVLLALIWDFHHRIRPELQAAWNIVHLSLLVAEGNANR